MVLLSREDGVVELRVNGVFVMDSAHTETERDLALIGLEASRQPSRVLVGGLGLGFTVQMCLEDPRVERLTVVEIEQPVVDWFTSGLVPSGSRLSGDSRLEILVADLADHLDATDAAYDVVLLDIDNGPGHLVHQDNERVYTAATLRRVREMLTVGGVLVVWSASPSPALEQVMHDTFQIAWVTERDVDLQGRDEHYFLYVGRE